MGITRAEYIRLKGLEPIDRLQKTSEQKNTAQRELIISHEILDKLNRQGIYLNRIIRSIDSCKTKGEPIEQCLADIADIKSMTQQILNSIAKLKAN